VRAFFSPRRDIRRFLADRLTTWRISTVVVTHDLADAAAMDGEVIVIERGSVSQRGRLEEPAANPATAFVRELTCPP
jgi:molybdate transport system ATP-binding protein